MLPSHFLSVHFNIILLLRLDLPSGLSPSGFPTKPLCSPPLPHTHYMPRPSYSSRFDHPNDIWRGVHIIKFLIMYFLQSPVISSLLGLNILLRTSFSKTLSLRPSLNVSVQVSHPYKTTSKIMVMHVLITVICRVT
jgi:hypothetical protein